MSERGDNRFDGFGRAEAFDEKSEQLLHAYHDGELGGLARWRFERRLRDLQIEAHLAGVPDEWLAAADDPPVPGR